MKDRKHTDVKSRSPSLQAQTASKAKSKIHKQTKHKNIAIPQNKTNSRKMKEFRRSLVYEMEEEDKGESADNQVDEQSKNVSQSQHRLENQSLEIGQEQAEGDVDGGVDGGESEGEDAEGDEDEDIQGEDIEEEEQLSQNREKEPQYNLEAENERNLEEYQEELGNKGVVYMSRIPPYMTPNFVKKLLQHYGVERIYLLPESEWARKNRAKKGGSKRICFREGWIEFSNKKIAKTVALSHNGQKMVQKKGTFYSDDLWNLKYLPKFKWHNLTEKLAHEERLKKERLRLELDQERKVQEYYAGQVQKSRTIEGIVKKKEAKGQETSSKKQRRFGQMSSLKDEDDRE